MYHFIKNKTIKKLKNLYLQVCGFYNEHFDNSKKLIDLCLKKTNQYLYINISCKNPIDDGIHRFFENIMNTNFNCSLIIDLTRVNIDFVLSLFFNIQSLLVKYFNKKNIYFKFKYNNKINLYLERCKKQTNLDFFYKKLYHSNKHSKKRIEPILICNPIFYINSKIIAIFYLWTLIDNLQFSQSLETIIFLIYEYSKKRIYKKNKNKKKKIKKEKNNFTTINIKNSIKIINNILLTNNFDIKTNNIKKCKIDIIESKFNHLLIFNKIESKLFNKFLLFNNSRFFN